MKTGNHEPFHVLDRESTSERVLDAAVTRMPRHDRHRVALFRSEMDVDPDRSDGELRLAACDVALLKSRSSSRGEGREMVGQHKEPFGAIATRTRVELTSWPTRGNNWSVFLRKPFCDTGKSSCVTVTIAALLSYDGDRQRRASHF